MVSNKASGTVMVKRVIADRSKDFERILDDFVSKYDLSPEFRSPFIYKDRVYAVRRHRVLSGSAEGMRTSGEIEVMASFADSLKFHLEPSWDAEWVRAYIPDPRDLEVPAAELFTSHNIPMSSVCPFCFDRRIGLELELPDSQQWIDMLPDYDPDDNTIRDASCIHCKGGDWYGPSCLSLFGMWFDYSAVAPFRSFNFPELLATPNKQVGSVLFKSRQSWDMKGACMSLDTGRGLEKKKALAI